MEKLGLNEIRERYLSFFESKNHLRMESFPLVPQNDKTLLLINAGMAPLKPYFTGEQTPPAPRVTTCQKCIRTPDIDNVGKTARHGTYFEMLPDGYQDKVVECIVREQAKLTENPEKYVNIWAEYKKGDVY